MNWIQELQDLGTMQIEQAMTSAINELFELLNRDFPTHKLTLNYIPYEDDKIKEFISINPHISELQFDTNFDVTFETLIMIPHLNAGGFDTSSGQNYIKFLKILDTLQKKKSFSLFKIISLTNGGVKQHQVGKGYIYQIQINTTFDYEAINCERS